MNAIQILTKKPSDFIPSVEVAAGYISYNNMFLLLKRHPTCSDGNKWCLPGGKIELNETPIDAVAREVKEEAGFDLLKNNIQPLGKLFIRRTHVDYILHMFSSILMEKPSLKINIREHLEGRWVTYEEAIKLPLILGGKETLSYYMNSI